MSSSIPYNPAEPMSGTVPQVAADRRAERMLWWLAIAAAVTSVVLGVIVLVWPDATLFVAAVLFGAWLAVHGVIHLVDAITATAADSGSRAITAVIGVLFVIAGVICLRNVVASLTIIATIIGISWLIGGIIGVVAAFGHRYAGPARLVVALLGGLSIIGGLIVLVWPGPTLATIVVFTGIWMILMGIVQFFLALRSRPT